EQLFGDKWLMIALIPSATFLRVLKFSVIEWVLQHRIDLALSNKGPDSCAARSRIQPLLNTITAFTVCRSGKHLFDVWSSLFVHHDVFHTSHCAVEVTYWWH